MNLQKVNPEEILLNSDANIFLIIFLAPNGDTYSWGDTGFSITSLNDFNGFSDLKGVMRNNAAKEFYKALNNVRILPFESGKLQLLPIPKFD
jgi:hypothetical protein